MNTNYRIYFVFVFTAAAVLSSSVLYCTVLLKGDVENFEANLSALHPFSVRYVRKHFQTQFQNAQINYYCIAPDIKVLTWS